MMSPPLPSTLSTSPPLDSPVAIGRDAVERFALLRPPVRRRGGSLPLAPPVTPVFFAGPENALVAQVATATTDDLIDQSPIVLIGPTGVGKTTLALHLAERLRLAILADRSSPGRSDRGRSADPMITSGDDYGRQYAAAVSAGDSEAFRGRIDAAEVWVIDQLEALAGKGSAQTELAARLDARQRAGRVSILTTNRWPCEQPGLQPELASRLGDGLSVLIRPPGAAARRRIAAELQLQHPGGGADIDPPTGRGQSPATARTIEASARQTSMRSRAGIVGSPPQPEPAATDLTNVIIRRVARQTGVTATAMRSGKRQRGIVQARSMAMYLCRQLTDESLQSIGRQFGGRDHTTVMHALQKIETLQETDAAVRRVITDVRDSVVN